MQPERENDAAGQQREWHTSDFNFELPPERIAQTPLEPRDSARLLQVSARGLMDYHVRDFPDLLNSGDLLVLNNTRVIPARLYGRRGNMRVEILLHKRTEDGTWLAFARPGKRLREGDIIIFAVGFSAMLLAKREEGEVLIRFDAGEDHLTENLERFGEPPLPPYIRRSEGTARADRDRYQTIYAEQAGAIAAPTAGLHFTKELFARLEAKGIRTTNITLHVGAGTFLPVKVERVADHRMHAEWGEIAAQSAEIINQTRARGNRIVAIGTTSLRLMESAKGAGGEVRPFRGETSIFMTPGHRFETADLLLTNFHLPKSTLFMLVAAFAGLERIKAAYAHAIEDKYRFYSYGDATLLEKA